MGREECLQLTSDDDNSNNDNKKQSCFEYSNAKLTFENLDEIFCFQLHHEMKLNNAEYYLLSSLSPKNKKQRTWERLSPVLQMKLQVKLGTPKTTMIRALCDSGTSSSIMESKLASKLRVKEDATTTWNTAGDPLITNKKAKIRFQLPQISSSMTINSEEHLATNISTRYDIIIGRDLMRELGIKLNFDSDTIELGEDLQIPMSDMDDKNEIQFATGIKEPPLAAEAVERVSKILDAKYAPVTSDQILDNSPHLTECQNKSLKPILQKHAKLFDEMLGKWKNVQHEIELRDPKTKPIPCRPYPVPVKNKQTLKLEIQ